MRKAEIPSRGFSEFIHWLHSYEHAKKILREFILAVSHLSVLLSRPELNKCL